MLSLNHVESIVALGAHPDDIELAAGGFLMSLDAVNPGMRVQYVLLTGSPDRHAEARSAASVFLAHANVSFTLHDLPDGRLPAHWGEVKEHLHRAAEGLQPDLVLCPSVNDAHQDHRLLGELVPTVFRSALALQYEIPKWDGDLGRPNVYVPLTDDVARRKVELLHSSFPSQKDRSWWDDEVFLGLARLRGMECRARYAEAFYCDKAVVRLGERGRGPTARSRRSRAPEQGGSSGRG